MLSTLTAAWLLRRTGKGTVDAAQKSAEASERSALAAEKSAQAAQDSVGVNAKSAAELALRAAADALAKRYQEAATLLGDDKAPVRLAGVYAMARLADDWEEQRQTCIDVLCSYVRISPFLLEGGPADFAESEVSQSVIRVIEQRLRPSALCSWAASSFNFRGAHLRNFSLKQIEPLTPLLLAEATFEGECSLSGSFAPGLILEHCRIKGSLSLSVLQTGHSIISLAESVIDPEAMVIIELVESGQHSALRLDDIDNSGYLSLQVQAHLQPQGKVMFHRVASAANSRIAITCRFEDQTVNELPNLRWSEIAASQWRIEDDVTVTLNQILLDVGALKAIDFLQLPRETVDYMVPVLSAAGDGSLFGYHIEAERGPSVLQDE